MSLSPALEVRGLVKRYRGRAVVDHLDLVADRARVTALLGPNGAGKTTTVECCEGLRTPDAGTIDVLGLPAGDRRLRARVGVMLQDGGLPAAVPAGRVLPHLAAFYARPRDPARLSARLGLDEFARTPVRRLSGGQRQRLALAAALLGRPELVFLDEPSAGLDPQSRNVVWELVRELRDEGTAVLLTSHQMTEVEALADTVVVVDGGRTIARGTVDELTGSDATVQLTTDRPLDTDALTAHLRSGVGTTGGASGGSSDHEVTVAEQSPLRYRVTATVDPTLVAAIAAWCADHDVLVTSLDTGRRTLEDVFLDLTGRDLR